MDIQLAICDDEKQQRTYLEKLAVQWAGANKLTANIHCYGSAENFKFARETDYDILLLDIQMGGMSGVELAKELRRDDERTIIVFITAVPDFIQEGYDVSALHYLMKPVDEAKFFAVMDKAAKLLNRAERTLLLPVDGETMRIAVSDILYIESFAHYADLTMRGGGVRVKMPSYKLEQQLGEGFIRCHRSYIVALRHISKITKTDVVLDGGEAVPLSRRLYNEVNKAFINYFKGTL